MKKIKIKKIKLSKNKKISTSRYYKIILEDKFQNKYTDPINGTPKYNSFYKGEHKNNRADGWGEEILIPPQDITGPPIPKEYYQGEWKKGKRHGYGSSFNYYPGIGRILDPDLEEMMEKKVYFQVRKASIEFCSIYNGLWDNGYKNGEGEYISYNTYSVGEFKKNKLHNGIKKIFTSYYSPTDSNNQMTVSEVKNGKLKNTKKYKEKKNFNLIKLEYKKILNKII